VENRFIIGEVQMNISIANDFSDVPAGRYLSDGDYSGEKFREDFLLPALRNANESNLVIVDINGVEGYGSSFLEEAFGGLVRKGGFSEKGLKGKLKIIANEEYSIYKEIIENYIKEA